MSAGRRNQKYRREPLDEATSTQVPGENQHRPRDVAWFGLEYDPECDCLWNWGDGPESIDGSPREMYWYPKVRPLNRIQDRADYILEFDARRARNKHVSAITQQLDSSPETTIDWTVHIEKVCRILSHPAPKTNDRLDELLEDILSFVQNAPRREWQAFLSSMGNLHPDYIPVLPWFRLRQAREPLARPDKGLVPHLIREWAHSLVGSELVLRVIADNFTDRKEILHFLGEVKTRHFIWHDELARAFSLGAATLRSIAYPSFHVTIPTETRQRTFEARVVPKVEILDKEFAMGDWLWGHEALLAPEVVHYRFFEDDIPLPGHISLFEAIVPEDVDAGKWALVLACFGFRAPRGLFREAPLEDLFRILHHLALSRGARGLYVTNGSYWKQSSDVPLHTLPRMTDKPAALYAADPVREHANARIGSPGSYFGSAGFEFPAAAAENRCFLEVNEAEVRRIKAWPRQTPITVVNAENATLGSISDWPRKSAAL